jgi:hypothetical protein
MPPWPGPPWSGPPGCEHEAVTGTGTAFTEGLVQAGAHVERLSGARQQGQHRCRVDLERAAHGRGQGAGEGGVGQFVEAVGLQRLQLGLRHLEHDGERRDVQAALLARIPEPGAGGGRLVVTSLRDGLHRLVLVVVGRHAAQSS